MTTKDDAVEDGCALFSLALFAAGGIGWVWNVVKIFQGINDPFTAMMGLRILGTFFFPIGCIVGWL